MSPCRCSTCTADRWGHRLIGFVVGLLLAHLLWSLILVSAASRPAVHPGAPVPSWSDAGGRRTGVPRLADRPVRHGGERLKTRTMRPGGAPTPAGRTETSERLIPMPAPRRGTASYMAPSYGRRYLALPGGPGIRVRVCGAAGCVVRVSTDAGPDREMQRAGRVVDLSWWDWQAVSGLSPARGLAPVTVEVLR